MTVQYHFTGLLRHALLAAAALTIGAGPALAQGSIRSAVIPGTLPAPARLITDRTTIGQAEAALNAAVTQYRLGGRCRITEKVEWRGSGIDEAAIAVSDELERLDYDLTFLPGGTEESFNFTARRGSQLVLATYQETSTAAMVTWCALDVSGAGPRPPSGAAIPSPTSAPAARPATPARPTEGTARLPSGRYVCSTNIGSYPNMQYMALGELQLRADGTYQGVRHGGGGPVARYTYNPVTKDITWTGGVGTNFGILKGSSYQTATNGQAHIRIQYQSKAGGYTNTMTCQRETQ